MPTVSLKAHFDGQTIQLDEPFLLPTNAPLLVTVLSPSSSGDMASGNMEQSWPALSQQSLSRAYGEGEPHYSEADILP